MTKKCIELLENGQKFGAEFTKNQMSNHLPMALIALSKMGGSDAQLDNFFKRYVRRLKPKTPAVKSYTAQNWDQDLGQHQFNQEYVDFFSSEINKNGVQKTLEKYLPKLMPGVSGGAFHPMIRLSYALDINHKPEIAEALASWAMAYQEFQISQPTFDEYRFSADNLVELLDTLAKDSDFSDFKVTSKNIFGKISEVMKTPSFAFYANALDLSDKETTLNDISKTMATLFEDNHDFTILHGLTSAQAFRDIQPFLSKSEQHKAFEYYTQALTAAYVTVQCPKYPSKTNHQTSKRSWSEIFNKACQLNDDHKIKLIYTCYKEHQQQPNEAIYKEIATKFTFPQAK